MAGDWIPMRLDLWECPQVVRIMSATCPHDVHNASAKCQIVGALYRTWSLIDRYADDGVLHGYTAEALDQAVGIDGWSENLQHVGWLIIESQSLVVPGFEEWFSTSAKRRLKDAKRKREIRGNGSAKCPQDVRKVSAPMRTTEEKITEQNSTTTKQVGSSKRARPKFNPPEVQEVKDYASDIDAEAFVDHYTANGWRVGRNPMKCWKSAVRNWRKRQGEFSKGNGKGSAGVADNDIISRVLSGELDVRPQD